MITTRSFFAAAVWLVSTSAALAQGTITSGTTSLQFVGTPFTTGTGNANLFFGSTSAFGTDQLFRYGWAYNQGVGTSTRPFSTLDTPGQGYSGNVATLTWGGAGAGVAGFARWDAVLTITLTEIAPTLVSTQPGSARVDSVLRFTASAGNAAAINFNLFHDLDFDIIGTAANNAANDVYRIVDATSATGIAGRAFDTTSSNYAEFIGAGAQRYEFNTGAALRTKLGSTSGTGTGNLATPAGTGVADWASTDGAVAFQWSPTLSAGQSVTISTSYTMNAAVAAIPEPSSWALMAVGVLALTGLARRRA